MLHNNFHTAQADASCRPLSKNNNADNAWPKKIEAPVASCLNRSYGAQWRRLQDSGRIPITYTCHCRASGPLLGSFTRNLCQKPLLQAFGTNPLGPSSPNVHSELSSQNFVLGRAEHSLEPFCSNLHLKAKKPSEPALATIIKFLLIHYMPKQVATKVLAKDVLHYLIVKSFEKGADRVTYNH